MSLQDFLNALTGGGTDSSKISTGNQALIKQGGEIGEIGGAKIGAEGAESKIGGMSPELFAIIADKVGSNIAPGNVFSGVGSLLGAGSLVQKKTDQQKGVLNQFLDALTAPELPGPTAFSIKMGKDGQPVLSMTGNLDSDKAKKDNNAEGLPTLDDYINDGTLEPID